MVTVEVVDKQDLDVVARDMYMESGYLDRVRQMMASGDLVLIAAKQDAKYVGRVSLWLASAEEYEIRDTVAGAVIVNALEVTPGARRKGIGTQMLDLLEATAKQSGRSHVAIGVEPDNLPAREMYESRGYRHTFLEGKEFYMSSWDETNEHGETRRVEAKTLLMMKEL